MPSGPRERLWTKAEKTKLRRLWHEGILATEIAARLNRSPAAVRLRRIMMDLPRRYAQYRGRDLR